MNAVIVFSKVMTKPAVVSLYKNIYPHCSVVVRSSRNGFERDLHRQNCLFHSIFWDKWVPLFIRYINNNVINKTTLNNNTNKRRTTLQNNI